MVKKHGSIKGKRGRRAGGVLKGAEPSPKMAGLHVDNEEVEEEMDGSMEAANLSNNEVDTDHINDIKLEILAMGTALLCPCIICGLEFISNGVLDEHMNLAHSGAVAVEVEEGMDIAVKACNVVGLAEESPRHEEDGDHNAFRKVGIDASPCGICIIAIIIFINVIVISQCAQLVSRLLSNLLY